jgi:RimJ/RimL family protein N-acetyltransferase
MVEAANAVISLLFDKCGYEGIVTWHASGNNMSQRVIEKLGFTRLGRCSFKTDFGMVDGFEYGLLNKDWLVGRDI